MSGRVVRTIVGVSVLCVVMQTLSARTIYVATNGNDNWSGHYAAARKGQDGPLATLPPAIRRARLERKGNAHVDIVLRGGIYALNEPIILTAEDSDLTISAYKNEDAVVTGQTVIAGWERAPGSTNLWRAKIPDAKLKAWNFRELFVNNHRMQRARTPNDGFFHLVGNMVDGQSNKVRYAGADIKPEWAKSGEVELMTHQLWAGSRNRIVAVDTNSHVVTLGGRAITENKENNARYFIENTRDALDQPGEWFFDPRTGEVLYWPEAGEDMTKDRVTVPHLTELIVFKGTKEAPVEHVTLRGLTFADADWRLAANGYCDEQAAVPIHGAVRGEFANDCVIEKCEFARLGGYAIDLGRGCMRDRIVGNVIHDIGGGGVRVGDPGVKVSFDTPCAQHEVSDNLIHNIGVVYPPAVGIILFHTARNRVVHNEIHHTYYTAISVGWSWGYEPTPTGTNIIEFNHLHDIGQRMLSDMGGIYTLGLEPGTVLRNNLIHDVSALTYGGWGLYTDEGTTGEVLENNIVYRCRSASFHQHYGKNNVLRNNIFAFGGESQIVRTLPENHMTLFFTNNIVYYNSGELFNGNWTGTNFVRDYNLYFDTRPNGAAAFEQAKKTGNDAHSIFADPLFVDPAKNEFTLKKNSPALKIGFKPIDMTGIGIRKKFARKHNDETD